jgi:hypothetical protein
MTLFEIFFTLGGIYLLILLPGIWIINRFISLRATVDLLKFNSIHFIPAGSLALVGLALSVTKALKWLELWHVIIGLAVVEAVMLFLAYRKLRKREYSPQLKLVEPLRKG